jgi:hypothetical protein
VNRHTDGQTGRQTDISTYRKKSGDTRGEGQLLPGQVKLNSRNIKSRNNYKKWKNRFASIGSLVSVSLKMSVRKYISVKSARSC